MNITCNMSGNLVKYTYGVLMTESDTGINTNN